MVQRNVCIVRERNKQTEKLVKLFALMNSQPKDFPVLRRTLKTLIFLFRSISIALSAKLSSLVSILFVSPDFSTTGF